MSFLLVVNENIVIFKDISVLSKGDSFQDRLVKEALRSDSTRTTTTVTLAAGFTSPANSK